MKRKMSIGAVGEAIRDLTDLITVEHVNNTYTLDMHGSKNQNFKITSADANAKTITIINAPSGASLIQVNCLIICIAAAAFTHTGVTFATGNPTYSTGQSYQETYDSINGGASYAGYSTRRR